MEKEISAELLDRYSSNNCTDAEKEFVESWYESREALPALFNDRESNKAQQWSKELKAAIGASTADREINKDNNLRQVSLVQSWFLKTTRRRD